QLQPFGYCRGYSVTERQGTQSQERTIFKKTTRSVKVIVDVNTIRTWHICYITWFLPAIHIFLEDYPGFVPGADCSTKECIVIVYFIAILEGEEDVQINSFIDEGIGNTAEVIRPDASHNVSVLRVDDAIIIDVTVNSISGLGIYIKLFI